LGLVNYCRNSFPVVVTSLIDGKKVKGLIGEIQTAV